MQQPCSLESLDNKHIAATEFFSPTGLLDKQKDIVSKARNLIDFFKNRDPKALDFSFEEVDLLATTRSYCETLFLLLKNLGDKTLLPEQNVECVLYHSIWAKSRYYKVEKLIEKMMQKLEAESGAVQPMRENLQAILEYGIYLMRWEASKSKEKYLSYKDLPLWKIFVEVKENAEKIKKQDIAAAEASVLTTFFGSKTEEEKLLPNETIQLKLDKSLSLSNLPLGVQSSSSPPQTALPPIPSAPKIASVNSQETNDTLPKKSIVDVQSKTLAAYLYAVWRPEDYIPAETQAEHRPIIFYDKNSSKLLITIVSELYRGVEQKHNELSKQFHELKDQSRQYRIQFDNRAEFKKFIEKIELEIKMPISTTVEEFIEKLYEELEATSPTTAYFIEAMKNEVASSQGVEKRKSPVITSSQSNIGSDKVQAETTSKLEQTSSLRKMVILPPTYQPHSNWPVEKPLKVEGEIKNPSTIIETRKSLRELPVPKETQNFPPAESLPDPSANTLQKIINRFEAPITDAGLLKKAGSFSSSNKELSQRPVTSKTTESNSTESKPQPPTPL